LTELAGNSPQPKPTEEEIREENKRVRRLQLLVSLAMSVISQSRDMSVEEATEMVAATKRAALAMFPDKEFAFDLIYKPRLQRLLQEKYRIQ
jgi:hypothetical protein